MEKTLAEHWSECLAQAEINLSVGKTREVLNEMISGWGIEGSFFDTQTFPFLGVNNIKPPWGEWRINSEFEIDLKGNHRVSFSEKNRLKMSGVEREAFRLMEEALPLVEVEEDDDYNHYHRLFLRLGEIEGKIIYLKIANVSYQDGED